MVYDQQKDTDEEVKDHIQQNLHLREKVSVDTGLMSETSSKILFSFCVLRLRLHLAVSLKTPPSGGS